MAKLSILTIARHTGTEDGRSIALTVKDLPIEEIGIKENIRQTYEGIEELQASIRRYGLLQPITVYRDGERYWVKTGHRRYLAYRELYQEAPDHFNRIRCIISDDSDIQIIQLVENVQRVDLSPKDLYDALTSLREQGCSHAQIAELMGKSEGYVKKIFVGVNEIDRHERLQEIIGYAGVTIEDIIDTKGIPDERERVTLLEQRKAGIITRAELREQTQRLKGSHQSKTEAQPVGVTSEDTEPAKSSIKLTGYAGVTSKEAEPAGNLKGLISHAGVTFQDAPQVELRLNRERRQIVLSCEAGVSYERLYKEVKTLLMQQGIVCIEPEQEAQHV